MKKYEVLVEEEQAKKLEELLHSLSYVKHVKETGIVDVFTLDSEESLAKDWLVHEDDELQSLYNK